MNLHGDWRNNELVRCFRSTRVGREALYGGSPAALKEVASVRPAQHLHRRLHPLVRRHETPQAQGPRILGAGSIALISLAAVLTLRGFPSVAEYGW
jgi:hypothetical protein